MKKFAILLTATMLFILCACHHTEPDATSESTQNVPSEAIMETHQPVTTPPKNTDPTELTAPTEPIETKLPTEPVITEVPTEPDLYTLTLEDWYNNDHPDYPSQKTYLSQTQTLQSSSNYWICDNGDGAKLYRLTTDRENCYVVKNEAGQMYRLSFKKDLSDYWIICCDGITAYFYGENNIVKADLLTGKCTTLLKSVMTYNCYNNLLLYYITTSESNNNKQYTVGRIYLPSGRKETYYESTYAVDNINLINMNSTADAVCWTMYDPKFVDLVNAELHNYEYEWDADVDLFAQYLLLDDIENDNHTTAFLKFSYDPSTKKVTSCPGILDECWYGSEGRHDHFNPISPTLDDPIILSVKWNKIGKKSLSTTNESDCIGTVRLLPNQDGNYYVYYGNTDGIYIKISDIPAKEIYNLNGCVAFLSTDNQLYIASYDGKTVTSIYKGKNCYELSYDESANIIALVDSDSIMLIDLNTMQYRQVIRHKYIDFMQYYNSEIYFVVSYGLSYDGYAYDLSTGEIIKQYRL